MKVFLEIYPQTMLLKKLATALEAEIDRLVYELYGLSEEEIGIVENK